MTARRHQSPILHPGLGPYLALQARRGPLRQPARRCRSPRQRI